MDDNYDFTPAHPGAPIALVLLLAMLTICACMVLILAWLMSVL